MRNSHFHPRSYSSAAVEQAPRRRMECRDATGLKPAPRLRCVNAAKVTGWRALCPRGRIVLVLLLMPVTLLAATRTVSSLADSGPGSLREAIQSSAAGD